MKRNMNNTRSETPGRGSFVRQNFSRFASVFLGLSFVLVFSTNVLGLCAGVNTSFSEADNRRYIAQAPNDAARYYSVGLSYYCGGKVAEGVNYMEKASDMGEITASYFLGLYYRSDKTGDISRRVPEVQENYDAAIFYYERTASLIESDVNYPGGIKGDLPSVEGNVYMSVRTYLALTSLYYNGYVRAIQEMLKKNVSYTDTIKVLVNMQSSAERCLARPSLLVWKNRQSEIANSKKVICGAYKSFADKAFILESRRKEVAKRCDAPLSNCSEHKAVVNSLVEASQIMAKQVRSVSPI